MIEIPLETARLTIRRFQPGDLSAYLQFMLDEASTRYLAFDDAQKTERGATALFDFVLASYDTDEPVHAYAIADGATDTYVGSCGYSPYNEGVMEIYYCINAEHRGNGFAVEATRAVVGELTQQTEVRAYCHAENRSAHAVARAAGLKPIGQKTHRHSGLTGEAFVLVPRSA